jgi:F0F1-type ATP synthase membrane subunit b/b'
MDWGDVLRIAASFFLVVTGVTLAYALVRVARTLDHLSAAIDKTVDEATPLFGKAGEALDQVSGQLANAERITGPAADAIDAAERSARAVIAGVGKPINAVADAASSVDRAMRRVVRRPRD